MRFSEAWLRTYVDPPLSTSELAEQLTMAGLEVGSIEPVSGKWSNVLIGEIIEIHPHPDAERLKICRVQAGRDELITIVCGAPNARPGLKAPLALEGATWADGRTIQRSQLRGVTSYGMLCSAQELGIEESAAGLLELPCDAPVGTDLRDYLLLNDNAIELELTPNRADCLSIEGIAREVALLNHMERGSSPSEGTSVNVTSPQDVLAIHVEVPEACPRYIGRCIRGISRSVFTPVWMKERLRRSGLRAIDPIVDVTNYVLLECGQPLHAFDIEQLVGGITVRYAKNGETLELLNGQTVTLGDDELVIADEEKVLALAGIMGGSVSAVTEVTTNIFVECAFFSPGAIRGKARRYGLNTDSSHRFERGVDPVLQMRAIERAIQLILEIAGGEVGPVVEIVYPEYIPKYEPIYLREARITRLLGLSLESHRINNILSGLGFRISDTTGGWLVTPPSFRFDIVLEADVIEELGRVYGYNRLPRTYPVIQATMHPVSESVLELERAKNVLVDRGYCEAITYSFVDPALQMLITPDIPALPLKNPLSSEMAVMRTTLWVGLLIATLKNTYRQHSRVRLFETGLRFSHTVEGIEQRKSIAGVSTGPVQNEQWGMSTRQVDFYDVKSDIEALFALTGRKHSLTFVSAHHPALHPGQAADLFLEGEWVGHMGMLHPQLEKTLGFEQSVFLFELDQDSFLVRHVPVFQELSKFPYVRRDIAVIVEESVMVDRLVMSITEKSSELLREVIVFDVYRGQNLGTNKKSVALGLIWQGNAETLTDSKVGEEMRNVVSCLVAEWNAQLRE